MNFPPAAVDLSRCLRSTFGCVEFEDAACLIVRYLADPSQRAKGWLIDVYGPGEGWEKKMSIESIPGISPTMFAMLCAAGWIKNVWFPKGAFVVSEEFIERLREKADITAPSIDTQ